MIVASMATGRPCSIKSPAGTDNIPSVTIAPTRNQQVTLGFADTPTHIVPRRQIRDTPNSDWKTQAAQALAQVDRKKFSVMTKSNARKSKPKKQQPRIRKQIAKGTGHTELTHYLGYLNHRHHDVKGLRSPSATARRIARWTSWGRVVTTSGTASTQTTCLIFNPMRWCEGTVWKGSDALQNRPAAEVGALTNGNVLLPSSGWGTAFVPSEGFHNAPSSWAGNHFGPRRWLGLTFHVRYLGTALNAGGEITVVHDDTAGGAAGSTPDNLRAHPRARRFALPANGRVVSINIFPSGEGADFATLPQYNTIGSAFSDADVPGDHRVYGLSGITSGVTQIAWGKGNVPWGWNTALLINPAADGQRFEITCEMLYEGQLATVSSSAAESERVQRLPVVDTVPADPEGAALVDTLTHAHVLKGPNTNRPSHTFNLALKEAMSSLAPLAKRVAMGQLTSMVEGMGF